MVNKVLANLNKTGMDIEKLNKLARNTVVADEYGMYEYDVFNFDLLSEIFEPVICHKHSKFMTDAGTMGLVKAICDFKICSETDFVDFAIKVINDYKQEKLNGFVIGMTYKNESGRIKVDNAKFEELINIFKPLFLKMERIYFINNSIADNDDLLQVAYLAVFEAVISYKNHPKCNFVGLCKIAVKRRLIDALRKHNSKIDIISMDMPKPGKNYESGDKTITLGETLESDDRPEHDIEDKLMIAQFRSSLNKKHRKILDLHLQNYNNRKIANILSVSPSTVDRAVRSIYHDAKAFGEGSREEGPVWVLFFVKDYLLFLVENQFDSADIKLSYITKVGISFGIPTFLIMSVSKNSENVNLS